MGSQTQPEPSFSGTSRYRLVRQLGAGGMGVVYEVEDGERHEHLALKSIRRGGSDVVYRLKREFRELSGVRHPNLVKLLDLVVDQDDCFFTMELIDGLQLMAYLRGTLADSEVTAREALAQTMEVTQDSSPVLAPALAPPADVTRLRKVLPQLVAGLGALHAAGKIHRDVKPSNVLVCKSDERVVLVDFGLVAAADDAALMQSSPGDVIGTLGYMAPEQCRGEARITPAADFYALGTLLYEALTGRLPYLGTATQVLLDKQERDPLPPEALRPEVPRDLAALAMRLLARDPGARPGPEEILAALGSAPRPRSQRATRGVVLAGRDAELARLAAALTTLERHGAAAVLVEGASGMGKSSLVRAFLERARLKRPDLVVLHGRCYERESVPYQALDSLIDHLSAYWRALPESEAAALLPLDASLLTRLFPVLERVPAVARAPQGRAIADPQELRRRGFGALREVLVRLGRRRPLVLVLDDLQWGDASSFALLADLLGPPDPPTLALILSSRPEGAPALVQLARGLEATFEHVVLEPLGPQAARTLASQLLGDAAPPALAERIAAEAAGSPFFIGELSELVRSADVGEKEVRIDDVLARRIALVSPGAQVLLELVALAGQPVSAAVLATAGDRGRDEVRQQLEELRDGRFVRQSGALEQDQVEPFHDRIRDAVLARMAVGERRWRAAALAQALEQLGEGGGEQLAALWRTAGEPLKAAPRARAAADQALSRLDFARAATLYKLALDCGGWSPLEQARLEAAHGIALVDSGSSREAADVLAQAAQKSQPREAMDLRRRSAEALVRGGYFVEGMRALTSVMRDLGLPLAGSTLGAVLKVIFWRIYLAIRGLEVRPPAAEIPVERLMRLDALWTSSSCLLTSDFLRAAHHQARYVSLALDTGEPFQVARALCMEGVQLSIRGHQKKGHAVLAQLRTMLDRTSMPYVEAMDHIGQAVILMQQESAWKRALVQLRLAEEHYRKVTNSAYELAGCRVSALTCQLFLGELGELAALVPQLVRDAIRRGDHNTAGTVRTRLGMIALVSDDPEGGKRDIMQALSDWKAGRDAYLVQDYNAMLSLADIALYQDRPEEAAELLARDRRRIRRSLIDRVALIRANLDFMAGRLAVAQIRKLRAQGGSWQGQRKILTRAIHGLARVDIPVGHAWGLVLEGLAAELDGQRRVCLEKLGAALGAFERLDMRLYAEGVRYRMGELERGQEGSEESERLRQHAVAWLAQQGVKAPERFVEIVVPRCS